MSSEWWMNDIQCWVVYVIILKAYTWEFGVHLTHWVADEKGFKGEICTKIKLFKPEKLNSKHRKVK